MFLFLLFWGLAESSLQEVYVSTNPSPTELTTLQLTTNFSMNSNNTVFNGTNVLGWLMSRLRKPSLPIIPDTPKSEVESRFGLMMNVPSPAISFNQAGAKFRLNSRKDALQTDLEGISLIPTSELGVAADNSEDEMRPSTPSVLMEETKPTEKLYQDEDSREVIQVTPTNIEAVGVRFTDTLQMEVLRVTPRPIIMTSARRMPPILGLPLPGVSTYADDPNFVMSNPMFQLPTLPWALFLSTVHSNTSSSEFSTLPSTGTSFSMKNKAAEILSTTLPNNNNAHLLSNISSLSNMSSNDSVSAVIPINKAVVSTTVPTSTYGSRLLEWIMSG